MHFTTLPPELNSARVRSGPGDRPLVRAGEAWQVLSERLRAMAAAYAPMAAMPSAAAMAAWLTTVAEQAEETAARAGAAAAAYRAAVAATVPPAEIAANRLQRTLLASTDALGPTAAAIAELDGEYDRMWARDADALRDYASASARAAALTPFAAPPGAWRAGAAGCWKLTAAPDVVSTGRQVMPAIADALARLASTPIPPFTAALAPVTSSLSKLSSLSAPSGLAISHLNAANKDAALRALFPRRGNGGPAVRVARGRAAGVGALSVPPSWTRATPPVAAAAVGAAQGWATERLHLVAGSEAPSGRGAAAVKGG